MPNINDIPTWESAPETSSHGVRQEEGFPPSERSKIHLPVPKYPMKRQMSTESLYSGSDVSEHFEFQADNTRGLIRTISNVSINLNEIPKPSVWKAKLHEFYIINYGAFLVLISQFFGAGMNVSTRLLETPGPHGEPMHPFQILFARQSITTLITTIYALWTKSIPHFPLGPPGKVRLLLVSRGLFGFLGVFGLYFSLLYLPISEATILTFLAPIGSCIAFAILIPGETFSRQQMLAGFISLLGVVFIARPASLFKTHDVGPITPQFNATMTANGTLTDPEISGIPQPSPAQHLQAVGVAMIGVVGAVGALTSIRAIGQRAHALLSVNYFSAWCTFVSLAALLVVPSVKFRLPGNLLEWGLLFILGVAGFVMQLLLTKGMAYGAVRANVKADTNDLEMQPSSTGPQSNLTITQTSNETQVRESQAKTVPRAKSSGAKATSMLYTQMLFALASDKVVFGITPGVWSWIGSGFILCGAIWVAADVGQKSNSVTSDELAPDNIQVTARAKGRNIHHESEGLLSDFDGESSHDHVARQSIDR